MSEYKEPDADGKPLKAGSFYWVKPVWDVDFTPPGFEGREYDENMIKAMRAHWSQQEQPARFEGYDDNGNEKWIYLGHDTDDSNWWPVCWIGKEIVLTSKWNSPHQPIISNRTLNHLITADNTMCDCGRFLSDPIHRVY
jgi:hypothetical protein